MSLCRNASLHNEFTQPGQDKEGWKESRKEIREEKEQNKGSKQRKN